MILSCLIISVRCQNTPITTTEKTELIRNAARWIEKGKMDAERIVFLKQINDTLNSRITGLLAVLKLISERDTAQVRIIESYRREIDILKSQKENLEKEMKHQNKLYRRQKLITAFVAVGTAGVAVGAYFIFLK